MPNPDNSIKLAHFMAKAGVGSRRACEKLIQSGGVSVNGKKIATPAERVIPGTDEVIYGGRRLSLPDKVYILLHKPKGYTCSSSDPHARRLAVDLLEASSYVRLFNVGRLDRDSEGLLIFTNDGDFADKIAHPRNGVEKEYTVHVVGDVHGGLLKKMEQGIRHEGELLKAQKVSITKKRSNGAVLKMVLNEGKKREVRRLCKCVDLDVRRLVRTRIGGLRMGKFSPGFNRPLTPEEMELLTKK